MLERWENSPKDKVLLHSVGRCKTVPSMSPYALKLETYLRMAKIPYELETKDMVGPKGKLPWITYNGHHVADSHLSIQYLNKKLSVDLNKNVPADLVAPARACRIMLEDHFFWGLIQYRIIENASMLPQLVQLPTIYKLLLPIGILQAQRKKLMEDQGIGKHTPTEIYEMTEDDLRTASKILGNKKFFGGEEPCEDDCAIFGMVAQAVWALPGSSFERLVNGELSNLKQYSERMKERFWPDWEKCLKKQ